MNLFEIIDNRRSIRRFTGEPVSRSDVQQILRAAIAAPSGKNRQPWEFFVLQGEAKDELTTVMQRRVDALHEEGMNTGSCTGSIRAMREAPVVIVIYNRPWEPGDDLKGPDRYMYSVDTQSIGAAIEHMLLAACALGLGSLWICDVFFTDEDIGRYLDCELELVAAVALGYPAEDPAPRPRRPLEDAVRWL